LGILKETKVFFSAFLLCNVLVESAVVALADSDRLMGLVTREYRVAFSYSGIVASNWVAGIPTCVMTAYRGGCGAVVRWSCAAFVEV
jgi:hypothetical protein